MVDADTFWLGGILVGIGMMSLGAMTALKRKNPDCLRQYGIIAMAVASIVVSLSSGVLRLLGTGAIAGFVVISIGWELATEQNPRSIQIMGVFIFLEGVGVVIVSGTTSLFVFR